jgi:hypothetical protein
VLARVNAVVPHSKKWTIRKIGLVISNSASGKIITTTELMTITDTIANSVVVVVVWLSLLCCCGLGCNDNCSGININAATTQLLGTHYRGSKPCNECQAVLLLFLQSMIVCRTISQNELSLMP